MGERLREASHAETPLEFTCGEKHVQGWRQPVGLGSPTELSGWVLEGGPQETGRGPELGSLGCPWEAGLHSRGTTRLNLSPNAFAIYSE